MSEKVFIFIPARYDSTRFTGKLLADVGGRTLLQRSYESALQSKEAHSVAVIAGDDRIAEYCEQKGINYYLPLPGKIQNGTERVAAVVKALDIPMDAVIVNAQADTFGETGKLIDHMVEMFASNTYKSRSIFTPCIRAKEEDLMNQNVVKIISSLGCAEYKFSRQVFFGGGFTVSRHVGIYLGRAESFYRYLEVKPAALEQILRLEQLRWEFFGVFVQPLFFPNCENTVFDINTKEDIAGCLSHLTSEIKDCERVQKSQKALAAHWYTGACGEACI